MCVTVILRAKTEESPATRSRATDKDPYASRQDDALPHTANELPHPHDAFALGLRTSKYEPPRDST